jgi:hypothetical protein
MISMRRRSVVGRSPLEPQPQIQALLRFRWWFWAAIISSFRACSAAAVVVACLCDGITVREHILRNSAVIGTFFHYLRFCFVPYFILPICIDAELIPAKSASL